MEIVEKRFTKKKNNNIIRKNYNPLNKELLKSYKREGLFMEEKDIVLKQIKEVLTLKEVEILKKNIGICIKIYKKGIEKGFNAKM